MTALGILTAGVAHEINNPNNFILLNGETLERAWTDVLPLLEAYYAENGDFTCAGMPYSQARGNIKNLTSGIILGAKRIQKIVNALGDFTHQDEENLSQLVDCNAVVDSAIVIVENLIKTSTDNFSTDLKPNLPKIAGNPQQLEQVLINLITNSCQALANASKSLAVSTGNSAEHVWIEVSDEGEGIPPENLPRIIDAFFTTKRDTGGFRFRAVRVVQYPEESWRGFDILVRTWKGNNGDSQAARCCLRITNESNQFSYPPNSTSGRRGTVSDECEFCFEGRGY